jgi:hypothetical protein
MHGTDLSAADGASTVGGKASQAPIASGTIFSVWPAMRNALSCTAAIPQGTLAGKRLFYQELPETNSFHALALPSSTASRPLVLATETKEGVPLMEHPLVLNGAGTGLFRQ